MRLSRKSGTTEHGYVEERLSAYLDKALPPEEQAAVERHLATCPRCQWSYATLRQTVQWTKELPRVPLPRVFTVPVPAQPARESRRHSHLPLLQAATAVLAVLFFFVAAGDVWLTGLIPAREPGGESVAREAAYATQEAAPTTEAAEAAPSAGVQALLVTEAAEAEPSAEPPAAAPGALAPAEEAEATASGEPPAGVMKAQAVTEAPQETAGPERSTAGTEFPAAVAQSVPSLTQGTEAADAATAAAGEVTAAAAAAGETPASGVLGAAPPPATEETEEPTEPYAAPQSESQATAAVVSGARVTATGGGSASPVPTLTAAVAAAAPATVVAEAPVPAPAAPAEAREGRTRALLEPVAPWLRIAEFVLGGAFLVLGAITAFLMLRRMRAH